MGSTHFHGVHSLLAPSSLLLATYTLHTELDIGGDLTYFYRLHSREGTNSSEALKVAAKAGVEESVLHRARAVMEGDLKGDNVEIGKVHELMEQLMDMDL